MVFIIFNDETTKHSVIVSRGASQQSSKGGNLYEAPLSEINDINGDKYKFKQTKISYREVMDYIYNTYTSNGKTVVLTVKPATEFSKGLAPVG